MTFREKSAWVMGLVMVATGIFYLNMALVTMRPTGWTAPPLVAFIPYVGLVVIASIVAQATLSLLTPKEANAPADERERPLIDRAGNWSGLVLGVGVVSSLLNYFWHGNGNVLFHMVMGSLILSQIAEYAFQIALFRRA